MLQHVHQWFPHADVVAAPAAYNKLIIRKQFSCQWYYGVATFLPGEPAPYVYQITYHDGDDQELMMPSTVHRAAVRSWQDIPTNVCNVLAGLGGRTLAGDEAPAMSPQQDPTHEAVVSAQQPTS
jgi:hypothetical protein